MVTKEWLERDIEIDKRLIENDICALSYGIPEYESHWQKSLTSDLLSLRKNLDWLKFYS